MLIFLCALPCEAKPVIDYYRLNKSADKTLPFKIYQQASIACIVSGLGAANMRRAMQWAFSQFSPQARHSWINLGIAGHRCLPPGSVRLVHRASMDSQDGVLTLTEPKPAMFETSAIISVAEASFDYPQDALIDMEAYAFASSFDQHSMRQRAVCIKIVSDNHDTPPTRDKARISSLIADNMPAIANQLKPLQREINE